MAPRLKRFDAVGPEPFQFKACGVSVGRAELVASANTPLMGQVGAPPTAMVQILVAGSSSFLVDGEHYHCQRGTLFYIPEIDRFGETGTRSLLSIAIQRQHMLDAYEAMCGAPAPPEAAVVLSRTLIVPPSRMSTPIIEKILMIARIVDLSLGNETALNLLALDDVLHRLIAMALWPQLSEAPIPRPDPATAGRHLSVMESYVHANLGSPIEISGLAREAGISTRLAHQLFLKKHGVSPAQWIKDMRLDHARALLLDAGTELRIRYIAAECGFAKQALFTAHYRRRFGETPAATRERALSGD